MCTIFFLKYLIYIISSINKNSHPPSQATYLFHPIQHTMNLHACMHAFTTQGKNIQSTKTLIRFPPNPNSKPKIEDRSTINFHLSHCILIPNSLSIPNHLITRSFSFSSRTSQNFCGQPSGSTGENPKPGVRSFDLGFIFCVQSRT